MARVLELMEGLRPLGTIIAYNYFKIDKLCVMNIQECKTCAFQQAPKCTSGVRQR